MARPCISTSSLDLRRGLLKLRTHPAATQVDAEAALTARLAFFSRFIGADAGNEEPPKGEFKAEDAESAADDGPVFTRVGCAAAQRQMDHTASAATSVFMRGFLGSRSISWAS